MSKQAPLRGNKLLKKVEQLKDLSREEKAKVCGYYIQTKDGRYRANLRQFLYALINAVGVEFEKHPEMHRGPTPTYRTKVHSDGKVIIGAFYTRQLGLQPGDEFEILVGRKHIHLQQIDRSEKSQLKAA